MMFVKRKCPETRSKVLVTVRDQFPIANIALVAVSTQNVPPGWPIPLSTRFVSELTRPLNTHFSTGTEAVDKVTVPNLSG